MNDTFPFGPRPCSPSSVAAPAVVGVMPQPTEFLVIFYAYGGEDDHERYDSFAAAQEAAERYVDDADGDRQYTASVYAMYLAAEVEVVTNCRTKFYGADGNPI